MAECNGCAEHARRVEIYSDNDRGCGDEFTIPAKKGGGDTSPPPVDTVTPVTPKPEPIGASNLVASSAAALATMITLN